MCGQCLTTAESVASGVALATAVFKDTVHRQLAHAGLVAPIDELARDARTVVFLRALDLDPVAILGERLVSAADRWQPAYAPSRARWVRPIGSHRRLAVQ